MDKSKEPTLLSSLVPHGTDVHYDKEKLNFIASFFCNRTYWVLLRVDVTSQYMMLTESLLDTGAGPSLVNKSSIPQNQQKYVKPIKQPQIWAATLKHVNVEGFTQCSNELDTSALVLASVWSRASQSTYSWELQSSTKAYEEYSRWKKSCHGPHDPYPSLHHPRISAPHFPE